MAELSGGHQVSRRGMLRAGLGGAGALVVAACAPGGGQTGGAGGAGAGAGAGKTGTFEFWQPWPIEQPTHGGPIGWKQLSDDFNAKGGPTVNVISPAGAAAINVAADGVRRRQPAGRLAGRPAMGPGVGRQGVRRPAGRPDEAGQVGQEPDLPLRAYETMTWSGKAWAMMQHPDIAFLWIGVSLMEENGVARQVRAQHLDPAGGDDATS